MNKITFIPLVSVLFFSVWLGIMAIIAQFGGWGKVAAVYRAGTRPEGKVFRFESGTFGLSNYNTCLTYIVNREGVYVSVFFIFNFMHPSLFIPWRDILNRQEKRMLWFTFVKADIGQPKVSTVYFPKKIFEAVY